MLEDDKVSKDVIKFNVNEATYSNIEKYQHGWTKRTASELAKPYVATISGDSMTLDNYLYYNQFYYAASRYDPGYIKNMAFKKKLNTSLTFTFTLTTTL